MIFISHEANFSQFAKWRNIPLNLWGSIIKNCNYLLMYGGYGGMGSYSSYGGPSSMGSYGSYGSTYGIQCLI